MRHTVSFSKRNSSGGQTAVNVSPRFHPRLNGMIEREDGLWTVALSSYGWTRGEFTETPVMSVTAQTREGLRNGLEDLADMLDREQQDRDRREWLAQCDLDEELDEIRKAELRAKREYDHECMRCQRRREELALERHRRQQEAK